MHSSLHITHFSPDAKKTEKQDIAKFVYLHVNMRARMLRKQYTTALFLIAIMVIMAHSIIPHHHHSDHICIELSFMAEQKHSNLDACEATACSGHTIPGYSHTENFHHQADAQGICHEANTPATENKHTGTSGCQLIEQLVFYPAPHQDALKCPICQPDNKTPNFVNNELMADYNQQLLSVNALPFRQRPYLLPYIHFVAGQCIGLRAPPAIS